MPSEHERHSSLEREFNELLAELKRFIQYAVGTKKTEPALLVDGTVSAGSAMSPNAGNLDPTKTYYLLVLPSGSALPAGSAIPNFKYPTAGVLGNNDKASQQIAGTPNSTGNFPVLATAPANTAFDVYLLLQTAPSSFSTLSNSLDITLQ